MAGDAVAAHDDATVAPPPQVALVADQQRLGPPVGVRHAANPVVAGLSSLVAGLLLFAGALGLRLLGKHNTGLTTELLRFAALLAAVIMVVALAYGAATLVRGTQSYYLYTRGIVHRRNNTIRAYAWAQIKQLRAASGEGGYYTLSPFAGRPMVIPIRGDADDFIDSLVASLRRHGRIVD